MTNIPAPGADLATDELYCLACDKAGHRTTECHSTHGINTPQARELHRLCCAAFAAVPASEPVKPTLEMIDAGELALFQHGHCDCGNPDKADAEEVYNAMRAAAPAPVSGMPDLAGLARDVAAIILGWEQGAVGADTALRRVEALFPAPQAPDTTNPTGATK